jgi:acyl-CoA reductase-like NAD-dependent aldehyde dehydrogenase
MGNCLRFRDSALAAYVFGRSDKSTDYVASRLEAGVIGVNNIAVAVPEMSSKAASDARAVPKASRNI